MGIGWVIHNVQTGKTQPYVATGNVHAVVVKELHFTPLVGSFFEPVIGVGARSSCGDEQSLWLTVVIRSRVIAVIMHGHFARRWNAVIRESDVSSLPGRPANR